MKKNILIRQNGITLIALVITIIVLLILAGVSIAMLTGDNGVLTQANKAKAQTEFKSAEEKVKLAIMGARAEDGAMALERLSKEIESQGGKLTGSNFPVEVKIDDYTFTVDSNGKITSKEDGGNTPEEQGTLGTVTGNEKENTTVNDSLGNQVVVPSGFKVVNPSETVPDGIIIEDVDTSRPTAGSQFVWIPVGEVTNKDKTKATINLSRYTFEKSTGNPISHGSDTITISEGITAQELETTGYTAYGQTPAENIQGFKESAIKNNGYYIARYEARTTQQRVDYTPNYTQLTVKEDEYVYGNILQSEAADLCREMYMQTTFKSDLMNSYAWDTAITFLQTFDNRQDKTTPYSLQSSINKGNLAVQGTNKLETKDVICNVFDISSNCWEWTTETGPMGTECIARGGSSNNEYLQTGTRGFNGTIDCDPNISFRPVLYL